VLRLLEVVGHADRACFDLNAHAAATGEDLTVKEKLDTPITKEVFRLTKKGLNVVKKDLKKDSKAYLDWIESQTACALKELQAAVQEKGSKEVNCGGTMMTLTKDHVDFEAGVEKTSVVSYTPGVVEPSFGIDRILFSILEHAYYQRPEEKKGDKQVKAVLSLKPIIAPYQVCILSLDQRIARDARYRNMVADLKKELAMRSLALTMDDTSATLGKRYARNDELGVPFACTFDFDTFEGNKAGTVTLRDRDSTEQTRVQVADVPDLVLALTLERKTWADAQAMGISQ